VAVPERVLRILILNTFPAWGGGEKWPVTLALGLRDKGHHVVISARPGSETDQRARDCGLTTAPFKIGPDIAFWKIIPFQKILRNHQIQVIVCCQNPDIKIGALAARLAGVPAIFARQGLARMKNTMEHRFIFSKYLDGIITNTLSIKKLYEGYGCFPPNFIHVVYDGPEIINPPKKKDLHRELGLTENRKIIITAGRLEQQKRFDLLVDVAKLAKDKLYNWSIIVVGEGKLEYELKSKAALLQVSDIIRFIGFRTDVLDLYYSSDLFIMSSDSEGMSNSLREAMTLGLPCISTDVYGVDELFEDGRNGISVPKGDANALFQAIVDLFSDSEKSKELGENARKRISSTFNTNLMIKQVEEIFLNQLNSRSK